MYFKNEIFFLVNILKNFYKIFLFPRYIEIRHVFSGSCYLICSPTSGFIAGPQSLRLFQVRHCWITVSLWQGKQLKGLKEICLSEVQNERIYINTYLCVKTFKSRPGKYIEFFEPCKSISPSRSLWLQKQTSGWNFTSESVGAAAPEERDNKCE